MMDALAAIEWAETNVWLTSFHGFDPGNWGFVGFSDASKRMSFIRRSEPGVLVVVYGTGRADPDKAGRVIGLVQCSHRVNSARSYMSPASWAAKEQNQDTAGKWDSAVKVVRAWRVAPDHRPMVAEFAHETYTASKAQTIGSQGMRLTRAEALKILDLDLKEVSVFGETPILESDWGSAREILSPSRAGPVSQSSFVVKASEGPKSLYVLALTGDTSSFLGYDAGGKRIVKVGMSRSPQGRCEDHNRALPKGAFGWEVIRSNDKAGLAPFANSTSAIAGEDEMKRLLTVPKGSLGGEFFLATDEAIEVAWKAGVQVARERAAK